MENNFLNLNEGSFPIKIKKKLNNLTNLDQLGEIKEDIKDLLSDNIIYHYKRPK